MYNKDEKTNTVPAEEQPQPEVTPVSTGGTKQEQDEKKKKRVAFIFYSVMFLIICILIYSFFFKKAPTAPGEDGLRTDLPDPADHSVDMKYKEYELVEGVKFINPDDELAMEEMFDQAMSINGVRVKDNPKEEDLWYSTTTNTDNSTEMIDNLMAHFEAMQGGDATATHMPDSDETEPDPLFPSVGSGGSEENEEIKELKKEIADLKLQQQKDDVTKRLLAVATGSGNASVGDTNPDRSRERQQLHVVKPVKQGNRRNVVSSLATAPRHNGFYGFGSSENVEKNTIKASTYGKQIIENGQNVRVRTEEPMQVGGQILPTGSILTGVGTVAVDRLFITFNTIEYKGVLTNVSLEAYDADGQRGLFVPGSQEMDAIRELGAELATSLGQTASQNISVIGATQSAAEELKKNLGQGTIQGVSRFAAKKLAKVRITVQDGHHILIVPNNND